MPRVRIDIEAYEELEEASEMIDATNSGLASEAIKEKAAQIKKKYRDE